MKIPATDATPDQFSSMATPRGKKRMHLAHLTGQRHTDNALMGGLNPSHPIVDATDSVEPLTMPSMSQGMA